MDQKTIVHLHNIAERKKELLPFVTSWMDLESIMLSETSQAVKEKYHMILLICGNKQNTTRDLGIKNNLSVTREVEGEG